MTKFMKNFRQLMFHCIAWTEPPCSRGVEEVKLKDPDSDVDSDTAEKKTFATTAKGKEKDIEDVNGEKSSDVHNSETSCDRL